MSSRPEYRTKKELYELFLKNKNNGVTHLCDGIEDCCECSHNGLIDDMNIRLCWAKNFEILKKEFSVERHLADLLEIL